MYFLIELWNLRIVKKLRFLFLLHALIAAAHTSVSMKIKHYFASNPAVVVKRCKWMLGFVHLKNQMISSGIRLNFLVKNGFNFQKNYHINDTVTLRTRYPKALEDATYFVLQFKDQAEDLGF